MASVTTNVTRASANWDRNAIIENYEAGEAMTTLDCVYLDTDEKLYLADSNTLADFAARSAVGIIVSIAKSGVTGIAGVTSAAAGDRVSVCIHGSVHGFSSLPIGQFLYVSETPGDIDDAAPANQFVIGRATHADTIFVAPGTFNAPS